MKDFLKKAFPFLTTAATAVGGPVGAAAMSALAKALGLDKDNPSMDDVAAAYVNATPEQRLNAQKEEHDFEAKMRELGFDHIEKLEAIASADRDSARQREIKTGDKLTPRILATVVVAAWVTVQFTLLFIHVVPVHERTRSWRICGQWTPLSSSCWATTSARLLALLRKMKRLRRRRSNGLCCCVHLASVAADCVLVRMERQR
jgi:hypothetical protein